MCANRKFCALTLSLAFLVLSKRIVNSYTKSLAFCRALFLLVSFVSFRPSLRVEESFLQANLQTKITFIVDGNAVERDPSTPLHYARDDNGCSWGIMGVNMGR